MGQTALDGKYTGYQRISPYFDMDANIRYYKYGNKNKEEWYYEVYMTIKGSLVTIEEVPVFFKNGKINYSSSDGGFYYYQGDLKTTDTGYVINVFMDSCKSCPSEYQPFLPLKQHLDTAYKIQEYIKKNTSWEGPIIFNPLRALTHKYFLQPASSGLIVEAALQDEVLFKRKD